MCASWPLGSWLLEYIYSLLSSGTFIFGMPGILSPVLVLVWTLVLDLGASQPLSVLIDLGMVIFHPLLHLWRIFIPFARSLHWWSPSCGGSGCMNVGSTPYLPFYVPLFTALFPLGAVVMIIPPYIL